MNTLLLAKRAFEKGFHAPHWGDKGSRFYNPEAIRLYYWRKLNIQKYGKNWLAQPSAVPATFLPQEYLDAL